jgi:hypothetical protein
VMSVTNAAGVVNIRILKTSTIRNRDNYVKHPSVSCEQLKIQITKFCLGLSNFGDVNVIQEYRDLLTVECQQYYIFKHPVQPLSSP